MDLTTLAEQNIWWQLPENISADPAIIALNEMQYVWEPHLLEAFDLNADLVYILKGPRQVGKTTLLKSLVKKLLRERIFHRNIFYFSCNLIDTYQELVEVLNLYLGWIRSRNDQRVLILVDEISFVKDWQRAIKHFADLGKFKNATLVLTGSHAVDIKKSSERLPGRRGKSEKMDKLLLPMTFQDYVRTVAPMLFDKIELFDLVDFDAPKILDLAIYQQEIDRHFQNYLLTGGFPLSVNALNAKQSIPPYIYHTYLQWIIGDLAKLGKQEHYFKQISRKLLESLTTPLSWQAIFKTSDIGSHNTVIEYIDHLKSSFILSIFFCLDMNSRLPAYRKNKKIYFADPFIYHTLHAWIKDSPVPFQLAEKEIFDSVKASKLVESTVGIHLVRNFGKVYYWQNRKEIDFVLVVNGKIIPVEVKYRGSVPYAELTHLKKFHKAIVVTQSQLKLEKNTLFIPACLFCLLIS
ncbi:MAG: ATP-binding protein [bacterium]